MDNSRPITIANTRSVGLRDIAAAARDAYHNGRYDEAYARSNETLAAIQAQPSPDAVQEARVRRYVAVAAYRLGRMREAIDRGQAAVAFALHHDLPEQAVFARNHLANAVRSDGQLGEARQILEAAFDLAVRCRSSEGQCRIHASLGALDEHVGDFDSAQHHYEQYLVLAETHSRARNIGRACQHLGRQALRRDDLAEARRLMERARTAAVEAQDVELQVGVLFLQARLQRREHAPDAARRSLQEVVAVAKISGNPKRVLDGYQELASLEMQGERWAEAIANLDHAERCVAQLWPDDPTTGGDPAYRAFGYAEGVARVYRDRSACLRNLDFPILAFDSALRAMRAYTAVRDTLGAEDATRYEGRLAGLDADVQNWRHDLKASYRLTDAEAEAIWAFADTRRDADSATLRSRLAAPLAEAMRREREHIVDKVARANLETELQALRLATDRLQAVLREAKPDDQNEVDRAIGALPMPAADVRAQSELALRRRLGDATWAELDPWTTRLLIQADGLLVFADDHAALALFLLASIVERELRRDIFDVARRAWLKRPTVAEGILPDENSKGDQDRISQWLAGEQSGQPNFGDMESCLVRLSQRRERGRYSPPLSHLASMLDAVNTGHAARLTGILRHRIGGQRDGRTLRDLRNAYGHADLDRFGEDSERFANRASVESILAMLTAEVPRFLEAALAFRRHFEPAALP